MEKGRTVVATGGAGGIGSKIVDRFLANGDTIFAIDNRLDALETLLGTRTPKTGSSLLQETFPKRTTRVALRKRSVSRLAEWMS